MRIQSLLAAVLSIGAIALGAASALPLTTHAQSDSLAPLEAQPLQRDTCGDGRCQPPDDCNSCPQDCGECQRCGDYQCQPPEDCNSCPQDCRC